MGLEYDIPFQTDLELTTSTNTLDNKITKVTKALRFERNPKAKKMRNHTTL
jgi:adenylylsulfate kinase-like enzyme